MLLGLVLAAGWLVGALTKPARTLRAPRQVIIQAGESAASVAGRLAQQGIIGSSLAFRLAARLGGRWSQVRQGTYLVRPGMSVLGILDLLASGQVEQLRLTIPEGWTVRQVSELLARHGLEGFPAVVGAVNRYPPGLPLPPDGRLEGYLFPDTYQVGANPEAARELADKMLQRFEQLVWRGLLGGQPPQGGRSLHELMTLASLVEAEAKAARERPLIAGVLLNRLRRGQRLECDATVQYALGERRGRLLYSDLAVDSPYNTYQHQGLPPGPICNPGLTSIQAALHPAAVPYLYYVARPDGGHVFSRTYQEHLAAVRAVRGR